MSLHLLLVRLILLGKLVDLFLLRVEHLELLLAAHSTVCTSWSITHFALDVLDVTVIRVDHLSQVTDFLVLLLDFRVVLLDAVHETLSSLWEREIVLVTLKLQVVLSLLQLRLLFAEMLGTLLERVLLELVLSGLQSSGDFFELLALDADLIGQVVVLLLKLFILVALLGVEIVQTSLVRKVDIVDLLLVRVQLILHITLLGEESVKVRSLLVVLVFDVKVKRLDVIWFGVASMLVQGQVVVGQVSLKLAHVFDEGLVFALQGKICGVVLVDILNFLFHFVDLGRNIVVLVSHEVVVVVAIVDLPTWSSVCADDTRKTVIGHGSIDGADLSVVADTTKVDFTLCGRDARRGSKPAKLHTFQI